MFKLRKSVLSVTLFIDDLLRFFLLHSYCVQSDFLGLPRAELSLVDNSYTTFKLGLKRIGIASRMFEGKKRPKSSTAARLHVR